MTETGLNRFLLQAVYQEMISQFSQIQTFQKIYKVGNEGIILFNHYYILCLSTYKK